MQIVEDILLLNLPTINEKNFEIYSDIRVSEYGYETTK